MVNDDHSIWASRPLKLDLESHSPPPSAPQQRRARAGTLPSRFPSKINTNVTTDHHGSLALISPDGNDIVFDRHSQSKTSNLAVGQQPQKDLKTKRSSPILAPIKEPAEINDTLNNTQKILNSTSTRTRSGSMNSLASSFRPFGSSIWDQPSEFDSKPDPLLIFTNELSKSSTPSRIRSYTLDTTNEWALPPQSFQRNRSQTLLGVPSINLNRFGKQHQLQHEATALGGVQLGGELSHVPTPALWISNVPPQATPYTLHTLFGPFGRIESARVVPSRCCAYVLFASTVQAIEAQKTANGMEMFTGNGPSTVQFVQVNPAPSSVNTLFNLRQPVTTSNSAPVTAPTSAPTSAPNSAVPVSGANSAKYILQVLGADKDEVATGVALLNRSAKVELNNAIPPLSELLDKDLERNYNTAMLRELRRKLENPAQNLEIVDIALDMQAELPILASDYIGNTVVQHIFELAPSVVRDMMLRQLKTVFAATGTHKNGTWAVQKMIDLASGPRQFDLVAQAIQPYLVPLLLDQFGNYVVQGCLKFGTPYSDFVYAGVAASLAKIAPNRFGARAIRAVLESKYTNVAAQRLVATAIAQQLPSLATNANGCLLVSWLLDHAHCPNDKKDETDEMVSGDPATLAQQLKTHALVSAQLIPQHLVALCTSKLGSGIVVKLASSPAPAASQRVFDALFEPLLDTVPEALTEILQDQSNQGASCISRLLAVFPQNSLEKQVATSKVRAALQNCSITHRRLMEDVGLEDAET